MVRGVDTDSAYDLLAEAFTRFLKSICKRPDAPVALLYRIAINLHIDSYRRSTSTPVRFDSEQAESYPATTTSNIDEQIALRSAMEKLYGDEQNLLLMRTG